MQLRTYTLCLRASAMGLLLLLSACAHPIATTLPALDCASFVPVEWEAGVPGAPLPKDGRWEEFGLRQTGQLELANGRTADTIAIVRRCEEREAQVREALTPRPWWKLLTPWREK